jgi:hypothetical protein
VAARCVVDDPAVARQDGEVIALARIERGLARIHLGLLRARSAGAVADVAHDGLPEQCLSGFA